MKISYEEDDSFDADDPGNVLRRALSEVDVPDINKRKLSELLYTMEERMNGWRFEPEDALLFWSLVEVARTASDEQINDMRM